MRGLYRYLSPFSPDQSGAVSVLYELGGMTVVLDAGGCTGNICGFDEPRWLTTTSAVFSAGLRDMDAILGRDDRLIGKLGDAIDAVRPAFIALVGTPVPSVIATDYQALCRAAERRFGLPAIYIPTTGMHFYERGEAMAYDAVISLVDRGRDEADDGLDTPAASLYEALAGQDASSGPTGGVVGVWGATPLDLPTTDVVSLKERLAIAGSPSQVYGMEGGLGAFLHVDEPRRLLATSPAGYATAKRISKRSGAVVEAGLMLGCSTPEGQALASSAGALAKRMASGGRVLVMHQQVLANEVRGQLERAVGGPVDVASFFRMDGDLMRGGDVHLKGEGEFLGLLRSRDYGAVVADPLFGRALRGTGTLLAPLPHFAVSGEVYATSSERDFFAGMSEVMTP